MVQKWATAEANRKYDVQMDEMRNLKSNLINIERGVQGKEEEIVELMSIYKEKLIVSE